MRELWSRWRDQFFGTLYPYTLAVLAIAGVLASALLALHLRAREQQAWEQDLSLDVVQYRLATQQALATVDDDLRDIARFVETLDFPDQHKFDHFASESLTEVFSISWMARIDSRDRSGFERLQRSQNPGFHLYDIRPDCKPADDRYGYAVVYQTTRPGLPDLVGLDVRCSAERMRIMRKAERMNQVLATPLLHLYNSKRPGLVVFAPVWNKNAERIPDPGAGLRGFIGAALDVDEVISAHLRHVPGADRYAIELLDVSDGGRTLLYSSVKAVPIVVEPWRYSVPMSFAGRSLRLQLMPSMASWTARSGNLPLATSVAGMLATLLLLMLLHSQVINRRRAEILAIVRSDDLVDRENRLAALFNHASLGIVRCNVRNLVLEANEAAAQMLCCRADALRGREFFALFTPWSEAMLRQHWQQPVWRELQLNSLSGEVIPVMVRGISLRLPSGEPYSWFLLDDLREVRHAERLKMQFISTVSHELRTPLTAIKGAIELLRTQTGDAADHDMLLAMAGNNANQLHRLIDNLLDMEQLAQGALSLRPARKVLQPLLARALAMAEPLAAMKSLQLRLSLGDEPLEAMVDPDRLLQVLGNLLSNAIKFSPERADIQLSARQDAGWIIIAVRDHGEGVPQSFRDRLFQPFAQADAGDDRRRGGTGLGLAISRSLIERMGGQVTLDASVTDGACFLIHLPAVSDRLRREGSDDAGKHTGCR